MKKNIVLLLVTMLLLSCLLTGYANNTQSFDEPTDINEIMIMPRANCLHCGITTSISCTRDRFLFTTYTHYFDRNCTVEQYHSNSAEECPDCGRYTAFYGPHPCLEIHSSCSAGYDVICPVG